MESDWDERSLIISAIDQDLVDLDEIAPMEEAIRNDEKFEDLNPEKAYKIVIGRAYIDPGVRHPADPGMPYWHIKYVEELVVDYAEGYWTEKMPSF